MIAKGCLRFLVVLRYLEGMWKGGAEGWQTAGKAKSTIRVKRCRTTVLVERGKNTYLL